MLLIINARPILNILIEDKFFRETETVSLLTKDQIVFASSDPALELIALAPLTEEQSATLLSSRQFGNLTVPKKTLHLIPFSNLENIYQWSENGCEHLSFIAPVADKSLYIWMDMEKKTISAPYIRAAWITVTIVLSITIASCFITIFISYLLSKTFKELITLMGNI